MSAGTIKGWSSTSPPWPTATLAGFVAGLLIAQALILLLFAADERLAPTLVMLAVAMGGFEVVERRQSARGRRRAVPGRVNAAWLGALLSRGVGGAAAMGDQQTPSIGFVVAASVVLGEARARAAWRASGRERA